ncbi:hypothetical protein N0V91_008743 [Didymella pomorum]|uniref:Uncharacterized protein n=1 Tax=Didymella pomorum TaxID=749634 RepID=A0A9W9D569_9PLEO|nr:hypothetical protein N0V91_008743 [Didymella pomorum]
MEVTNCAVRTENRPRPYHSDDSFVMPLNPDVCWEALIYKRCLHTEPELSPDFEEVSRIM